MKRQIIIILFALVVIAGQAQNTFEGHEYVDLGLPSGTLWATCNVGANSPEEYGDYFAWGETKPKESYRHESYQYDKDRPFTSTKYCADSKFGYNGFTDDLTELLPEDEASAAARNSTTQVSTKWIRAATIGRVRSIQSTATTRAACPSTRTTSNGTKTLATSVKASGQCES